MIDFLNNYLNTKNAYRYMLVFAWLLFNIFSFVDPLYRNLSEQT